MNGVCKQTATRMVSSSPPPHGLIHQLASMEPPCNTRVPLQWARESLPHKPDKRHVDRARKQEMKWGWVFFRKKVDLSLTQGALCTVSVFLFYILLIRGEGGCVRTQRTPFLRACAVRRAAAAAVLRCPATSAIDRYLLPAGPTAANPPQRRAAAGWDGRTRQRRTDTRQIDRPCSARYAGIANNTTCIALNNGNMSFSAAGPRL